MEATAKSRKAFIRSKITIVTSDRKLVNTFRSSQHFDLTDPCALLKFISIFHFAQSTI